jgi:hypothetical protein
VKCALALALALALSLSLAPAAAADDPKEQARALFESGLVHFDRGEWSAALADFLRSREIFPTRSATMNAAVCLRHEGRFDEALEFLEELLRTYTDLRPGDRAFAEKESAELRASVGAIDLTGAEPAATVVIDGRTRGVTPLSAPLRVPSGTRTVRVFKQGFLPFERRVDVAGRQTVLVEAKLAALTSAGRLVVTEAGGAAVDVLVDGVVVGKTPWEAMVAVGTHTVALRGEGDLGTPPADAAVAKDDVTRLSLAAEPLDASLRVVPTPAGALVSIDGVVVGRGVWEGRLHSGQHRVELAADGFQPIVREATLEHGERKSLPIALERDVWSGAFRRANPPRLYAELGVGPMLGLAFGGDVRGSCTGDCSPGAPFGLGAVLHLGYQLPTGLLLGLDGGYLALSAGTSRRATSLTPKGLPPDAGVVDDSIFLRGFRFGPSVGWLLDGRAGPFIVLRFGAGVFLGGGADERNGTFTSLGGAPFAVDASESPRASYLYAAPEARAGIKLGPHLEASVGLEVLLLAALDRPAWTDAQPVFASPSPSPGAGAGGDGLATFGRQTIAGSVVATMTPSVGLRYAY